LFYIFLVFQTLLNEAKDRLSEIQQNKERYKELLSGLIAQGLFQILENDVIIKCLPEEVELIKVSTELVFQLLLEKTYPKRFGL